MKFYCCGLIYSTEDPETYWCIQKYNIKTPVKPLWDNKKVVKEIVYTLCCKKNGCLKVEVHRYTKENGCLQLLEPQKMSGDKARKFLERTKDMRIRQVQSCPYQKISYSKKIPWVYGKALDSETQTIRYIDESQNRQVFKGGVWQTEIIKSKLK